MREETKVDIRCPACGIPMVAIFKGQVIQGVLQHKCGRCKRYWNVDYTNRGVEWVKGKADVTSDRRYDLNLSSGISSPIAY